MENLVEMVNEWIKGKSINFDTMSFDNQMAFSDLVNDYLVKLPIDSVEEYCQIQARIKQCALSNFFHFS